MTSASTEKHKIKITLVRHGQTDWNIEKRIQGRGYDVALNSLGYQQATAVAELLREYRFLCCKETKFY